jgi:hypothetical protein
MNSACTRSRAQVSEASTTAVEFTQAQGAKPIRVAMPTTSPLLVSITKKRRPFSRQLASMRAFSNPRLRFFTNRWRNISLSMVVEKWSRRLPALFSLVGVDKVTVVPHGVGLVVVTDHKGLGIGENELPVVE